MKPAAAEPRSPLLEPNFRRFWGGQAISLIGDGIFAVALPWEALRLWPQPSAVALALLARAVPRPLIAVVGGAVSDRMSRRKLMLICDAVQAVVIGATAVLAATQLLQLWSLCVAAALSGVAGAYFVPSASAIVPDLVAEQQLAAANGLNSGSRMLAANLAGPAVGGVLIAAAGVPIALALDAISFCVSVATLASLQLPKRVGGAATRVLADVVAGAHYIRSQPWIRLSLSAALVAQFVGVAPLQALIPIIVRDRLHTGSGALGFALAGVGVGGAVAVLRAQRRMSGQSATAMYAAWSILGLAVAGIGLARTLWLIVALAVVFGFCATYGDLIWTTLVQRTVPQQMLGRVFAADVTLSFGFAPLGFALAGPLAGIVGVSRLLAAGGCTAAAACVAAGASRRARPVDVASEHRQSETRLVEPSAEMPITSEP